MKPQWHEASYVAVALEGCFSVDIMAVAVSGALFGLGEGDNDSEGWRFGNDVSCVHTCGYVYMSLVVLWWTGS